MVWGRESWGGDNVKIEFNGGGSGGSALGWGRRVLGAFKKGENLVGGFRIGMVEESKDVGGFVLYGAEGGELVGEEGYSILFHHESAVEQVELLGGYVQIETFWVA